MLASGEYGRFLAARASVEKGRTALQAGQYEKALECARDAETNNPGFYQNLWLEAESLKRLGRLEEAARAGQAALNGEPALAGERRKIEALAKAAGRLNQAESERP
jgi:tetratricopeptide (TPR) repeat protein